MPMENECRASLTFAEPGRAVVRRVNHERGGAQAAEHGADAQVDPREPRREEVGQPALLAVGRVGQPPKVEEGVGQLQRQRRPSSAAGRARLGGLGGWRRGGARVGGRRADVPLLAQRREQRGPLRLPCRVGGHPSGGRVAGVREQRAGQRERRVRQRRRKVDERSSPRGVRPVQERHGLLRHPLGMMCRFGRLLVAAEERGRFLEAAVLADRAHHVGVREATA